MLRLPVLMRGSKQVWASPLCYYGSLTTRLVSIRDISQGSHSFMVCFNVAARTVASSVLYG
jgi:hypothetical protein